MNRSTIPARTLNFLFNAGQAVLGRGGQIDWSLVTSFYAKGKFTVKLGAAALISAVSITVDALTKELPSGTVLDFGEVESVTIELSGNEAIGQTAIGVVAITGDIPSGAILKSSAGEFMQLTAAASAGETSLTVEALEVAWESGDTATYQGGRKLVKLTEDGAIGETALTTEALQFAIADNAEAIADATGIGDKRTIPAGTVMARTSADLLIPRHDATDQTASEILQGDAVEGSLVAAKSGYGTLIECQVFENLLPDADTDGNIPSAYKTELATNGARVNYSDWTDSRVAD